MSGLALAEAGPLDSPWGRRGGRAWVLTAVLCGFYVVLYFADDAWSSGPLARVLAGLSPLSQALRAAPADKWFFYSFLYTAAVLGFGLRFARKHRGDRHQLLRVASLAFFQLVFAFLLPGLLRGQGQPEAYLTYSWPLAYDAFMPGTVRGLLDRGGVGLLLVVWSLLFTFVLTPLLTWRYGKRWYCGWVCGCGALAETAGDSFRHLSDKGEGAWRLERWSIHGVAVLILIITVAAWLGEAGWLGPFTGAATSAKGAYGVVIGAVFSGVIGVGLYPVLGPRIWCRFGCPMAAYMGLIQRLWSRFRITVNGGQCISCGRCSSSCEMGIDVRAYAQREEPVVRAGCVGCGICATVCPRGVLSLENGDPADRGLEAPLVQIGRVGRRGG